MAADPLHAETALADRRHASANGNGRSPATEIELLEQIHRLELAKMRMQLVLYRKALLAAGLEPPDRDGEDLLEMWRDCRHVIETANEFVMRLGTSKELLEMAWR